MENNASTVPEQNVPQENIPHVAPTPAPVFAPPQPQPSIQQPPKGPVRPITAIIIAIVYVFLLIIFIVIATIGISLAQDEAATTVKTTPKSISDTSDKNTAVIEGFTASGVKPDVVFRGTAYKHFFHEADTDFERYQFMKEGDTDDSWSELITILKYTNTPVTLDGLDTVALAEKKYAEDDGGYIVEARTIKEASSSHASTSPANFLVASYRYPEDDEVELTFTIFYIKNNALFADWYAVKFTGETIDEAGTKAKAFLAKYKQEIQAQLETRTLSKDYWTK
jgi:hypothetical protein